jgi:cytochrome P450
MSTGVPAAGTRTGVASTRGPSPAIPGPGAPSWVQTAQFAARPDLFLERNWRRYGDTFSARIRGFGTGRDVFLADPRMVEQVFKGSPTALRLGEIAGPPIIQLAGERSILALDGEEHLRHRRLVLPPFHGERMLKYTSITAEAADRSLVTWPVDEPFALRPKMAAITIEVVMRAVFGVERGDRHDRLSTAVLDLIETDLAGTLALTFPSLRRDFGPVRAWSRLQRSKDTADALIYSEIASRRAAADLSEREDILSMLLQTELTDEEIHDELITMLVAGHETTATALSWAFDLLLHHPRVLTRLQAELAAGDESYLQAVVQEVLRLRPVVATAQRVVRQPTRIGDYEIDAGITLFCAIWLVHRQPGLYPQPLEFRPERFLDRRPGTYEWIPFGGGVRRCIGASFAPMEMRTVLRHILTHATLEPATAELEKPRNKVVLLAPKNGTVVVRRAR